MALLYVLATVGAYALLVGGYVGVRLWRSRRRRRPDPYRSLLDARREALYPMRGWH